MLTRREMIGVSAASMGLPVLCRFLSEPEVYAETEVLHGWMDGTKTTVTLQDTSHGLRALCNGNLMKKSGDEFRYDGGGFRAVVHACLTKDSKGLSGMDFGNFIVNYVFFQRD